MAYEAALKGAGFVNPNPMVGAVIVRDDKVLAVGYHAVYGDLHAERSAFRAADEQGIDCSGATMYVTLEPCCHHGKQPPCTQAIIEHHIAKVVVAMLDPNALVAGKGVQILRDAGIEVEVLGDTNNCPLSTIHYPLTTLLHNIAYMNRSFVKFITTGRPWVLTKYAMTLDGKIATSNGDSKWVSGPESRQLVHQLRRQASALVTGINTVLADDPMLNTRIEGEPDAHNPVRVVLDRHLRIPDDCQLVQTARQIPLIVVHEPEADHQRCHSLEALGVTLWCVSSLTELMQRFAEQKFSNIMIECGGTLNDAFLREGLIDEVYAFVAPKLLGGKQALTPVDGIGFPLMRQAISLKDVQVQQVGNDVLIHGLV